VSGRIWSKFQVGNSALNHSPNRWSRSIVGVGVRVDEQQAVALLGGEGAEAEAFPVEVAEVVGLRESDEGAVRCRRSRRGTGRRIAA
jgi:hypothetical protein